MIWLLTLPAIAVYLYRWEAVHIALFPFVFLLHVLAQICLEILALLVGALAYLSVVFTTIIYFIGQYYEYRNNRSHDHNR